MYVLILLYFGIFPSEAQYLPYYNNRIQNTFVSTFGTTIKTSSKIIVNETGVAVEYPGQLILPDYIFNAKNETSAYISTGILSKAYSTWGICQNRIYFNFIPSMCQTKHKIVQNCTDWSQLNWVDTELTVNQFSGSCSDWNLTNVDCHHYLFNNTTRINPLLSNYSMFYSNGTCILYEEPTLWDFVTVITLSCVVSIAYLQFTYISATITNNVCTKTASVIWVQFIKNAFFFNEIIALVVFLKVFQLFMSSEQERYLPIVEITIGRYLSDIFYSTFIIYDAILSVYVGAVLFTQQIKSSRFKRIEYFVTLSNIHRDANFVLFSMSVELILVYSLVQFSSVGLFTINNIELMNVLIGMWILFQLGKYTILIWITGKWFHIIVAFFNVVIFFMYSTFFLLLPLFIGPFEMNKSDPWIVVIIAAGVASMMVGSYSTLDLLIQSSCSYVGALKQYQ